MDRNQTIRAIRDAIDIVALISEKVKLRKTGSGWMGGPCPIHGGGARTPCISVLPDKGQWHCFSCQAGGDALDWLQQVDGITFHEALEDLAKRAGIELPTKERRVKNGHEDLILDSIATAQEFYVQQLRDCITAQAYLLGRGLSDGIIETEGIGYAPAGWDTTLQYLQAAGMKPETAETAGLATRSQRGTLIDFLRDRITIPIRDARSRIIAFGGRALPNAPDDTPKYLNSRETPVFKKGEMIFGLHHARGEMREKGAVIVEGYFDAIGLWDRGVKTAVAPLGTALTESHLRQIQRWTSKIILAFDGDKAGMAATEKALAMALPLGFDVRLLEMPEGEDPDTWSRTNSDPTRAITEAPDWASYALAKASHGRDFRHIEDRLAAAREISTWIAYLPQDRQEEVRIAAAHDLRVNPNQIVSSKARSETQSSKAIIHETQTMDEGVKALLAMAMRGDVFLEWVRQVPRAWWEHRDGAGVLESFVDSEGDKNSMAPGTQTLLRGIEASTHIQTTIDPKRLRSRLEREYLSTEIQGITRNLATHAMDETLAPALHANLTELRARLARITRGIR